MTEAPKNDSDTQEGVSQDIPKEKQNEEASAHESTENISNGENILGEKADNVNISDSGIDQKAEKATAQEAETSNGKEKSFADNIKESKKEKSEKAELKPFDFKKIVLGIFTALASGAAYLLKQAKSAAKSVLKSSKAIGLKLTECLSDIGESVFELIIRGSKSAAAGLKYAAGASIKAVKHIGGRVLLGTERILSYVGKSAWVEISHICRLVFGAVFSFIRAVFGTVFGWISKKLHQPLLELWCFIITPFAHAWGGACDALIRFKNACKRGFLPAVCSIGDSLWRLLGAIAELLRFGFNYIAPAVCIVFLIGLIKYSSTLQYAISVTYNGNDIGTIENEATYNEAQSLVQDKVTFTDNQPLLVTPKFSVTVLNLDESEKQPVSDIDKLSETMIESGDVQIVYAYGLYINDELFGIFSEDDMQKIREALDARLNEYSIVNAVNVSFEDNIVISEGRFVQDSLSSPEAALDYINGGTEVEAYYVVQRGDTITKICENLGITREEFDADNPELSEGVQRDDIVTYHYIEPNLNVLTTYYDVYEQVIERTTEYVETSRREKYCEILLQHGSDGYENVTALVTLKNGVESDRTIVSRTVLEEMVPRKFRVGTKENTYLNGDTTIIDKLGTFCWPLGDEHGYISTLPGWRSWDSSNHMALDIAGIPRGTDIYAACSGRVTFSGWYAAYGELVIVNCGSGYECYYGHCSKLLVEEGDYVEKGDVIAEVGMTGSATGNHLHFEMRYHGDRINPLKALGGTGGHEIRQ